MALRRPRRVDHHVGLERGAVVEVHARDPWRRLRRQQQPGDGVPNADLDTWLGEGRLPQQPLQCRPPHDQDGQVLVAGTGLTEVGPGRCGDAADVVQGLEHVGHVVAHLDDQAGEEAVGLVRLRCAGPAGGEGLLGVATRRDHIAFEHDHLVAGAAEDERARQPADAGAGDQDAHRVRPSSPRARSWATASYDS